MRKLTLRARLRARFDRTLDRGVLALIGWLMVASVGLVLAITELTELVTPDDGGHWGHAMWTMFLNTIDTGSIANVTGSHAYRLIALLATVSGILVVSTLIGLVATGLNDRLVDLRKGRSPVIVTDHVVLLGWSEQVFIVIAELARARDARSYVVVLADEDKVQMEDDIRARLPKLGRTRVICRNGSPLTRSDLDLVSLDTARSVIVISPAGESADIRVIKALLLLKHYPWSGPRRPHVVAAIQSSDNMAAARLAGGEHAQVIDADDIAVRLVVQSHRESGLSTVCSDLLDFSGNELHLPSAAPIAGRSYGEALDAFAHSCAIGLVRADGAILVNPPMSTPVTPSDSLIVIAENAAAARPQVKAGPLVEVMTDAIVDRVGEVARPDRTLLVGWNRRAPRIIELVDQLVVPGSQLDVASSARPGGYDFGPRHNLVVGHKVCEPTSRPSLDGLGLADYSHIVILSDDGFTTAEADDRALVTLLHLRDAEAPLGEHYSIVTEMNDDANREIAQAAAADDFIVSNRLISRLMTQLAENRQLQGVFRELFDPSGSEIHLKPATGYVVPGRPVTFATLVEAARRRGQTAIGYRRASEQTTAPSYGVVLNPPKAELFTAGEQDSIICLAVS